MQGPDCAGIHTGDNTGSGHRAHWGDGVGVGVADAFGGELVKNRGLRILVAITAHHRGDVFECGVEDVGAVVCESRGKDEGSEGCALDGLTVPHGYCLHLTFDGSSFWLCVEGSQEQRRE